MMAKIMDFFQLTSIPNNQYLGVYDIKLVALSFFVAVLASFIALDVTGQIRDVSNTPKSRMLWLLGGAVAMGAGIWSMHFIGMLSFTIPGLVLRYEFTWTIFSLLIAMIASGFALYLLQIMKLGIERYIAGGIILGLAIASMHYSGMEAMLITLNIKYLPGLFFLSILIAIVASEAAIYLALRSNQIVLKMRRRIKLASAILMGIAICGMHYTGMAASVFTPLCAPVLGAKFSGLDPTLLAINIAGVTFIVLGIAFFASSYKEAINQQRFEMARQLGMAEISASVLHNVGNVLNSVNIGVDTVKEKTKNSKLLGLEKLTAMLDENKNNLSEFLTQQGKGEKTLAYLQQLASYWREEQKTITNELNNLTKNINFITEIISTQQVLSKTIDMEELVSINALLDEALLISGMQLKSNIVIKKQYGNIKDIYTNKIKLLQALVNILQNAKDALLASNDKEKHLTIKTYKKRQLLCIEVADNGIGISPTHLKKIFQYGFTTKPSGHGFGLHTTALDINKLGGKIKVKSSGLHKGSIAIIELPIS